MKKDKLTKVKTTEFHVHPSSINDKSIYYKADIYFNDTTYMFSTKTPEIFLNMKTIEVNENIIGESIGEILKNFEILHNHFQSEFDQHFLPKTKYLQYKFQYEKKENGKHELFFHYFIIEKRTNKNYKWEVYHGYGGKSRDISGDKTITYIYKENQKHGMYPKKKKTNLLGEEYPFFIFDRSLTEEYKNYKEIPYTEENEKFLKQMKEIIEKMDYSMIDFFNDMNKEKLDNLIYAYSNNQTLIS